MNERKILLFILSVIIYCLYSVHMWFVKEKVEDKIEKPNIPTVHPSIQPVLEEIKNETKEIQHEVKTKVIPLFYKNACSILEIFTQKPAIKFKETRDEEMETEKNTFTVIGITVFLVILALNALLDVLKVKEEERVRRKLNPNGVRRKSLAEFANKKTIRRESSKFGLQLFQIAESVTNSDEEKKSQRQTRPYTRGDSTNSYLSERKTQNEGSAPASIADPVCPEPKLVKRQSVAKLFGARPAPMVRRSSFPALPLNPEVQALMLGHRQPSADSDDEGDGRGRRVRIIRRY